MSSPSSPALRRPRTPASFASRARLRPVRFQPLHHDHAGGGNNEVAGMHKLPSGDKRCFHYPQRSFDRALGLIARDQTGKRTRNDRRLRYPA